MRLIRNIIIKIIFIMLLIIQDRLLGKRTKEDSISVDDDKQIDRGEVTFGLVFYIVIISLDAMY